MNEIKNKARLIKLAVFDVDGVMTDGGLLFGNDGQEYKIFNVRDGLGLVMLKEAGILTAAITGRESEIVTHRLGELRINYIFQGVKDKKQCLQDLCNKTNIIANQCSYTGDDMVDLPAFSVAGLSIAVADAHERVRRSADWITNNPGGKGAVREVCELLLDSQGLLNPLYQQHFET